jgi:hypothetical protein
MSFFLKLLLFVGAVLGVVFLALKGFLGSAAQKTAEDAALWFMGESRASYFLKSMPYEASCRTVYQ